MEDESFSEWQQIPSPSSATGKDELNNNDDDIAVTTEHLPINNDEPLNSAEASLSLPDYSSNNNDKSEGNNGWLKNHLRELTSRIICRVRNIGNIGTFSSMAKTRILAVLLVSLFYVMFRRRRKQSQVHTCNNLLRLIQQKEKKIVQLSLQISKMNDSLVARRQVPVFRVG